MIIFQFICVICICNNTNLIDILLSYTYTCKKNKEILHFLTVGLVLIIYHLRIIIIIMYHYEVLLVNII